MAEKFEYWLASLEGIRGEKKIQAAAMAGGAQNLFLMSRGELQDLYLLDDRELNLIEKNKDFCDPYDSWRQFAKSGMRLTTWEDPDYPERLRTIAGRPYGLFYMGKLPGNEKSVGIVGARNCTEAGRSIASLIGRRLAQEGVSVISGMAIGIDGAGHTGALQGHGDTFAVLGCGCDICYPKSSRNIYRNIIENGGVLSEYPPGAPALPYRFPERNRIISGLSDVLVIVEARESSGSLITADFALEQGKDIFAVPGRYQDSLNSGCNRLIGQGAGILYDVETFLENIQVIDEKGKKTARDKKIVLEKEERLVYSGLDLQPKSINAIIEETGLDFLTVFRILGALKQKQIVQETFQNYFCRRL